ncbi:MAG: hypothetical protein GF317_04400 [Candidatus Lokiarchaeota archaeon]|nr:hypothetical protein [Candidatus Lokiarchaeota archaeon]MBD3199130.1 hypothetical protein [Candidatus Lokiarchaeota archaeon]
MNENDLKFECIRCGRCCTDKNTLVNLTYSDIIRIKNGLDLSLDELNHILGFYIFEEELTEEDKKKMVLSPVETEKGKAFVGLIKKNDGMCYFYDEKQQKCLIYNLRPNFCRTFPFSFKVKSDTKDPEIKKIKINLTEKGKAYCPGIGKDASVINQEEWLKLGEKTIEDLNQNYHIMKEWSDLIEKEEISASAKNFLKFLLKIKERK